mmetsp:Transcript_16041/g.19070  ORF Transcript_16041/g.19070 Transcript_16041/m.19070 type:complete len:426 (-) Transcript_16041:171-1448(-)
MLTIVHSGKDLLSNVDVSEEFLKHYKTSILNQTNIRVYVDQKLKMDSHSSWQYDASRPYIKGYRTIVTTKGETIQADLVLFCTGTRLNNAIYPDEWLTNSGHISVRSTMQLEKHDHIFAIGDINNVPEAKTGYGASKQGYVCSRNIMALAKRAAKHQGSVYNSTISHSSMNGQPPLKVYRTIPFTPLLLSHGPTNGASNVGPDNKDGFFGKSMTSKVKGKNLLVDEYWKLFNQDKALQNEIVATPLQRARKNIEKFKEQQRAQLKKIEDLHELMAYRSGSTQPEYEDEEDDDDDDDSQNSQDVDNDGTGEKRKSFSIGARTLRRFQSNNSRSSPTLTGKRTKAKPKNRARGMSRIKRLTHFKSSGSPRNKYRHNSFDSLEDLSLNDSMDKNTKVNPNEKNLPVKESTGEEISGIETLLKAVHRRR